MANRDQIGGRDGSSAQQEFPFDTEQSAHCEGSLGRPVRRFVRLKEVLHRTGLGRSTIYRWMDEGRSPKPVRLGARSVAWIEHEIDQWLISRSK
ncbi:hypothetical protein EH30_09300 [Erythrobacter sp. JL475]|nr:hypothetical protein EH30_09300 [Erythrobacter sp. JL475]